MLAGLSFPSPFDVTVTADLVQKGKPDPECYLLAAEKMEVDPKNIVVFEDSVSSVKAASVAGSVVVGINDDHLTQLLLDEGAFTVIRDFSNVTMKEDQNSLKFIWITKKLL